MDFEEKRRKVEHLLRVKFPFSWAPRPIGSGAPGNALHASLIEQIEAERKRLMSVPNDEVEHLHSVSVSVEQARAAAELRMEEKRRFFMQPDANADFSYWANAEYWSMEEAIALLLGKDAERVTWRNVQAYVNVSSFARQFERLRTLALRAQRMHRGQSAVYPKDALDWAREIGHAVPEELEQSLRAHGTRKKDLLMRQVRVSERVAGYLERAERMQSPDEGAIGGISERVPTADRPPVTAPNINHQDEPPLQRQDRRLKACEDAGLTMPNAAVGRLPNGIGKLAEKEGVSRQAFAEDIRKALLRREEARGVEDSARRSR